jgi:hypothetical protein
MLGADLSSLPTISRLLGAKGDALGDSFARFFEPVVRHDAARVRKLRVWRHERDKQLVNTMHLHLLAQKV